MKCVAQKKHRIHLARATLVTLAFSLLTSCGSADFQSGGSGGSAKPTPAPPADVGLTTIESLTWFWQCASDPASAPSSKGRNLVINGEGSHSISAKAISESGVPLTISGRVCPPTKYPRDIIFVIDVSGSMSTSPGNDVRTGSAQAGYTCGRLQAVDAIIANIAAQGGDVRYGIVTFNDVVVKKSSATFSDRANLFADIAAGSTPDSVLCTGVGGTNYSQGLSGAQTLLQNSRPGALKEIYFVSDGLPNAADENPSKALATKLKTEGVSVQGTLTPVKIATVMLGAASSAELQPMASLDKKGASMHANASDASKLAATLSSLAANDIDDGVVRYRATGSDKWTEVALKPNMKGYDFAMPAFQLIPSSVPNGLDLEFEYRDNHNNKFLNKGNIVWSTSGK